MKHTKLTSLLLVLAMMITSMVLFVTPATAASNAWDGTVATAFAGGSGTESDPFLIADAGQLRFLSKSTANGVDYIFEDGQVTLATYLAGGTRFESLGNGTGLSQGDFFYVRCKTPDNQTRNLLFDYTANKVYLNDGIQTRAYAQNVTIGGVTYYTAGNNFVAGDQLYGYDPATLDFYILEGVKLGKTNNVWHLVKDGVSQYNADDPNTYNAKNNARLNRFFLTVHLLDENGALVKKTFSFLGDYYNTNDSINGSSIVQKLTVGDKQYTWASGLTNTHPASTCEPIYTTDGTDTLVGYDITFLEDTLTTNGQLGNAHFALTSDIVYNEKYEEYESWETTAPKNAWTSICPAAMAPFRGTFDGNGHTIYGLYSNTSTQAALFGYVAFSGNVCDVNIAYSTFLGTNGDTAALARSYYPRTLDNIHITNVLVKTTNGGNAAGLVVNPTNGETVANNQSLVVSNCSFDGKVITTLVNKGNAAGFFCRSDIHGPRVTFNNCTVRGEITGANNAAGFWAQPQTNAAAVFNNCVNYAKVTATGSTPANGTSVKAVTGNAAGFVALLEGSSGSCLTEFNNCANFGDITANTYASGLVGNRYLETGWFHLKNVIVDGTVKTSAPADIAAAGGVFGVLAGGSTQGNMENVVITATFSAAKAGAIAGDETVVNNGGRLSAIIPSARIYTLENLFVSTAPFGSDAFDADLIARVSTSTAAQLAGTATAGEEGETVLELLNANAAELGLCSWYQLADRPGFYQEYVDAQNLKPYAASVTLGDALAINLYVAKSELANINYVVPTSATVTTSEVVLDGVTYLCVTLTDIAAADIAKDLTVTFRSVNAAGNETADAFTVTYSVADYIERMTGKDPALDALLAALSDYAKAAAGEDVDVDAAYAAVALTPVANVDSTYVTEIALDLTDSIRPVIKVADGVAQVTVAIYGETHTYAVVDGEVIIDCLTATSLNNVMTLTFVDADGAELGSTNYAIANYIKKSESLDLAKALAVYMQAVRTYNGLID